MIKKISFTRLEAAQREAMLWLHSVKIVTVNGCRYRTTSDLNNPMTGLSLYSMRDRFNYINENISQSRRKLRENEPEKRNFSLKLLEIKHKKWGSVRIEMAERVPIVSLGITGHLICPMEAKTYVSLGTGSVYSYLDGSLKGHPHNGRNGGQCTGDLMTHFRTLPLSEEFLPLRKALLIEAVGLFNRADMYNGHLATAIQLNARKVLENPEAMAPNWNRKDALKWLTDIRDAETGEKLPKGEQFSRLIAWYITGDWKNWADYHPKKILENRPVENQAPIIVTEDMPEGVESRVA